MKELPTHIKNKILKRKNQRYKIVIFNNIPSTKILDLIKLGELGIFCKHGRIYCKVNDKHALEIPIFKDPINDGISSGIYEKIKAALENNILPNDEDIKELLIYTTSVKYTLPEYKFNISLSSHNHWLTEEEADKQILSYAILDLYNKKKYFEEEKKFLKFYKKIYNLYFSCFNFCNKPDEFYTFDNEKEFIKICKKSLREQKFIDLHVDEIELSILSSFDLEVILCINDHSIIEEFKKKSLLEGLHLLY